MSRYCVMHEKLKLTDPAKYEQYKLSHECGINHRGSAPAMEKGWRCSKAAVLVY